MTTDRFKVLKDEDPKDALKRALDEVCDTVADLEKSGVPLMSIATALAFYHNAAAELAMDGNKELVALWQKSLFPGVQS